MDICINTLYIFNSEIPCRNIITKFFYPRQNKSSNSGIYVDRDIILFSYSSNFFNWIYNTMSVLESTCNNNTGFVGYFGRYLINFHLFIFITFYILYFYIKIFCSLIKCWMSSSAHKNFWLINMRIFCFKIVSISFYSQ